MEERRLKWGYNELAEKKVNPILQFLAYFWGPMPCMIWLAVAVEFVKGALGASTLSCVAGWACSVAFTQTARREARPSQSPLLSPATTNYSPLSPRPLLPSASVQATLRHGPTFACS